ncbi:MAG: NRDE family protein [Candidatus Paceibacterota bacterium]
MCLIVFAYKCHPTYPLILAGNRDEFYDRPTQNLHVWESEPPIIAGKDLKAGGTWLGVTDDGLIATLTNYRDIKNLKDHAPSRGDLITEILLSDDPLLQSLKSIEKKADLYNGFNLIAGNLNHLYYLSNHNTPFSEIQPGYHSISNSALNTPWPKTEWALQRFKKVTRNSKVSEHDLFELLLNTDTYPIENLPNTGLSPELEKAVSSVFIQTDNYGTRSSTVLTVDRDHHLQVTEKVYEPGTTFTKSQNTIEVELPGKEH